MKKFQNLPFVLTLLILASFSSIAFSQTAFPNSQIASWQMAYNSGNKSFSQTASPIWQIDSIGCFCGDCKNGIGTYIFSDGGWYKGEFKNGKMNGKGEFTLRTNGTYGGVFKNNKIINLPSLINNGDHSDIYSETGHYNSLKFYLKYLNQRIDSSLNSKSNDSFDFRGISGCLCGNCSDGIGTYVYSNLGIYTGEWRYGMKNGKGKYTFKDGGIYDGEWKDGKYDGKGKYTFKDGSIYDGEWKNDKYEGNGKFTYKNGETYEGEYKNGTQSGQGKFNWSDGRSYVGQFIADKKNGIGTMIWPNNGEGVGQTYKGEWKDDMKNGQGEINWTNGQKYIGGFKDGKYDGVGTMITQNGSKYVGDWKNGMKNGSGTQTFKNGEKYIGNFKDDKYSGEGTLTKPTGEVFSGEWLEGEYQTSISNVSISTTPLQAKLVDDYYKFLDKCVKECNGGLVSTRNFRQIKASFSSLGYAALNDDEHLPLEAVDFYLHKTTNINWEHVTSININKMTFEYSCICIEFAEGFSPISNYVGIAKPNFTYFKIGSNADMSNGSYRIGGDIIKVLDGKVIDIKSETEYFDPIELDISNRYPNLYYTKEQRMRGGFSFVIKTERANECLKTLQLLVNSFREMKSNSQVGPLTKHEEFSSDGYLTTKYTDNSGIKQGRFEIKDPTGALYMYGNYKDNRKVGKWHEYGIDRDYGINGIISNECSCRGY